MAGGLEVSIYILYPVILPSGHASVLVRLELASLGFIFIVNWLADGLGS